MGSQDAAEVRSRRATSAALGELGRLGQLRRLRKRKHLLLTGELDWCVLLVMSGRLKLYQLSPDGKELILSLLEPGDLLVTPSDRVSKSAERQVEALEDAVLVTARRHAFEGFLQARPSAAVAVVRELAARVDALEERIVEMAVKSVEGRLATALLRLTDSFGNPEQAGEKAIGLRWTQQELAGLIGASRDPTRR